MSSDICNRKHIKNVNKDIIARRSGVTKKKTLALEKNKEMRSNKIFKITWHLLYAKNMNV